MNNILQRTYGDKDFSDLFARQIELAKSHLIIQTGYLGFHALDNYRPRLAARKVCGVCSCVYVQAPDHWFQRDQMSLQPDALERHRKFSGLVTSMEGVGIHINVRELIHAKTVIVDHHQTWSGSMNVLSHTNRHEDMTYWNSYAKAAELIALHGLDMCQACARSPEGALFSRTPAAVEQHLGLIRQRIKQTRQARQISQEKIAEQLNIPASTLSDALSGKSAMSSEFLIRVARQIDLEAIVVPKYTLPAIGQLLANYTPWQEPDPNNPTPKKKRPKIELTYGEGFHG